MERDDELQEVLRERLGEEPEPTLTPRTRQLYRRYQLPVDEQEGDGV